MKKLAYKLVKKLIQKKLKIAFAESCTGGMLSSIITSVSGSSKVFNLGTEILSEIHFKKIFERVIS